MIAQADVAGGLLPRCARGGLAQVFAAAVRDTGRAPIVGERTFGKARAGARRPDGQGTDREQIGQRQRH